MPSHKEYATRHLNLREIHDLTSFQRDLLSEIAGRDEPHGLAIKDDLEKYYESEIHHGRLSPLQSGLDTLPQSHDVSLR